jgi:hypothetical protein
MEMLPPTLGAQLLAMGDGLMTGGGVNIRGTLSRRPEVDGDNTSESATLLLGAREEALSALPAAGPVVDLNCCCCCGDMLAGAMTTSPMPVGADVA